MADTLGVRLNLLSRLWTDKNHLEAEILCNTAVERVMEDSGRAVGVRLENSEVISADYVISDAYSYDIQETYRRQTSH